MLQPLIDHAYYMAEKQAEVCGGSLGGKGAEKGGKAEQRSQVIDFIGGDGWRRSGGKGGGGWRKSACNPLISLMAEKRRELYYVWWRRLRSACAHSAAHSSTEYRVNFSQCLLGKIGAIVQ